MKCSSNYSAFYNQYNYIPHLPKVAHKHRANATYNFMIPQQRDTQVSGQEQYTRRFIIVPFSNGHEIQGNTLRQTNSHDLTSRDTCKQKQP